MTLASFHPTIRCGSGRTLGVFTLSRDIPHGVVSTDPFQPSGIPLDIANDLSAAQDLLIRKPDSPLEVILGFPGKRILPLALGILLLLAAGPSWSVTLVPGEPAPEFSLPDIDGTTVSLSQLRGKTILIAFWSTWCSRCEEELTFLKDQFDQRDDVAVILVNQDSETKVSTKRISEIRERLKLRFPILVDSGLVLWDRFGINALPTSVVIGKNGKILFVEPNFYWASPEKLLQAVTPG